MEYTKKYQELKKSFNQGSNKTVLDNDMEILHLPFNSQNYWERIMDELDGKSESQLNLGVPDSLFFENNHFTYPVFVPKSYENSRAILLLHGLNERTWDKYLPWAYYLATELKRPVILFPIAFHMNRSPAEWIDPKVMIAQANTRKTQYGSATLTYANAALSIRLSEDPLRFLKSGHQTADDLTALIRQIENGLIPVFKKGTQVDVFAYSIGAFVAQIMLLAFPQKLFSATKFFLFCGGSYFEDMKGTSRLIMDDAAFQILHQYYTEDIDICLNRTKLLDSLLSEFPIGKAFYCMLREENNSMFRRRSCHELKNKIYALALQKDTVIPASGIKKAMEGFSKDVVFESLDFPFTYSHEVPFPLTGKSPDVDRCFNEVFSKAKEFFN